MCYRDLRDNDLRTWNIHSTESLPSLEVIRATGNKHWIPDVKILNLKKLRKVQGVTWSEFCKDCDLIKTANIKKDKPSNLTLKETFECPVRVNFFVHDDEVTYTGYAYKVVKLGYSPQCLCQSTECANHEITYPYFRKLNELPKKLFYFQYILGSFLLCINLVIVVVVLSTRGLRTSASFILICSMAMSDTLIGVYTIGIAIFNPFTKVTVTPIEMINNDSHACPYLGFVFTTGQTTTVLTSLVLTVERYLAIVHCDKPAYRMTAKFTLGLSIAIWLLGILYALLPNVGVQAIHYHKWFQCTMPFHEASGSLEDTSTVTLIIAIGFVLIYLASIAFYIRIYIYVRTASANFSVGVQREARLAKRIAIVVCTNFVFFVAPTVLFLVYVYRFTKVLMSMESFSSLRGFVITGSWLPVTLLGINSLLNPILYACRHQRFQKEIRRLSKKLNRESAMSQESRFKRNNSSFRSPPTGPKTRNSLLRKENGESTLEFELSKYPNHKEDALLTQS